MVTPVTMYRAVGRANGLAILAIFLGLVLTFYNVRELRKMHDHFVATLPHGAAGIARENDEVFSSRPKYAVYGKNVDSGYLKHVYSVLDRVGFVRTNYNSSNDWTLLWAHDYPFTKLRPMLLKMKRTQRVNKLPGSGFVTNKVNLATSGIDHRIPKAFKVPNDTAAFKAYAAENPEKLFVQKNKNHRGIKIEKVDKINLEGTPGGSFIQEFVANPMLIDGYKFDVGVYTMITSVDPLRIYVYEGDALLRFCPEKYEPFDASNRDKYVVHDDYRPTWEVPTLAKTYSDMGYTFREKANRDVFGLFHSISIETLNAYIRSLGHDPDKEVWEPMYDVIRNVYVTKEPKFIDALKKFPHKRGFFELVRFDFVLDANLNLYLMEANMSPNLSTKHFTMNRRLYEQVLYSLLRLAGVARGGIVSSSLDPTSDDELEMQVSDKDLHVFSDECLSHKCSGAEACDTSACQLCRHCLGSEEREYLKLAFLEDSNKHQARRIFPKPISRERALLWKEHNYPESMSVANRKMDQWYRGKCLANMNWCN